MHTAYVYCDMLMRSTRNWWATGGFGYHSDRYYQGKQRKVPKSNHNKRSLCALGGDMNRENKL